MTSTDPSVVDNPGESRFELETDAGPAVLEYRRSGDRLALIHTEVPPAVRERGLGTRLVEAAFLEAREKGLRIVPHCPFVRDYVAKHPEVAGLVEKES
jgi:predicted GNAT family acetyltransferase